MLSATAVIRFVGYLLGSIFQRKLGYSKHIVEFMYRKRKQPCQINHLTRLLSPMKKRKSACGKDFLIKNRTLIFYQNQRSVMVRMAIQNFLKSPVISMVLGLSDNKFSCS